MSRITRDLAGKHQLAAAGIAGRIQCALSHGEVLGLARPERGYCYKCEYAANTGFPVLTFGPAGLTLDP